MVVVTPLVTHSLTSSHVPALLGPLRQTRGVVCCAVLVPHPALPILAIHQAYGLLSGAGPGVCRGSQASCRLAPDRSVTRWHCPISRLHTVCQGCIALRFLGSS